MIPPAPGWTPMYLPGQLQLAMGSAYRVYADAPDRQGHRIGFAVSNGRFYFTLSERTADVWVAEVQRK